MDVWYVYTGKNLIFGRDHVIDLVLPLSQSIQRLVDHAQVHARRHNTQGVDVDTFTAALLAPLCVQRFGIRPPWTTSFSSAQEVFSLFQGAQQESVAMTFINARIASRYAPLYDGAALAKRVADDFERGALLCLPRDRLSLDKPEILSTLPGALVFLLARQKAQRKAFSDYLRHGTPLEQRAQKA